MSIWMIENGSRCLFKCWQPRILHGYVGIRFEDRWHLTRANPQGHVIADGIDFDKQAQQRIEARHIRQRRLLEYVERQRAEAHIQMSQDPYLDAAS